jgi:hypothetical protein
MRRKLLLLVLLAAATLTTARASQSPNCCINFERTCQRLCEGVIVEFTCNPEACVAFCVCG